MAPGASATAPAERLAEKLRSAFKTGPFVRFTCEPSAVVAGKPETVQLRATFLPPFPTPLKPVVTVKEQPGIEIPLDETSASAPKTSLPARGSQTGRTFEAKLSGLPVRCTQTGPPPALDSLTLLLRTAPGAEPIAAFTLDVLSEKELDELRQELADELGFEVGPKP